MDDRTQQRAAVIPGSRAQGQPNENLLLRHRSAGLLADERRQIGEGPRNKKGVGDLFYRLVRSQSVVEILAPALRVEGDPRHRSDRGANLRTRAIARLHRLEDVGQVDLWIALQGTARSPLLGPDGLLVFLPNERDIARGDAEEPGGKVARRVGTANRIREGGRCRDANGLLGIPTAIGPEAANQARDLRTRNSRRSMRLVEDEIVEEGMVEEFHVRLAGKEKLELLHVREQDAGLLAGRAHFLAGAALLGRMDRGPPFLAPRSLNGLHIVGPRGARPQSLPRDVGLLLGRLADVHTKGDARSGQ